MGENEFFQDVYIEFHYLIDKYGFIEVERSYHSNYFGNAMIIFQNNLLLIKITKERDQIFADIASKMHMKRWFPLELLIGYIKHGKSIPIDITQSFLEKHDIRETSLKLEEFLSGIIDIFAENTHLEILANYQKMRAKAIFGLK